ncbi:MAG: hypothetical protein SFW66_08825 [Gammaproteobacteria bacterium]|nr:hypothetical protein [Gammaproteobacteria bacterium]
MFGNKNITVREIENGYIIEAYCDGKSQSEYVKKISKVATVLKRWFGENNKSQEDYDRMNREVTEVEDEKGAVKVNIKMTKN